MPKADTQFKKGQPSANPGGRPKALAEWRKSDEAMRLRGLSYKVLERALVAVKIPWKDRITAATVLLERIEGKVPLAVTGEGGGPVKLELSGGLDDVLSQLENDDE